MAKLYFRYGAMNSGKTSAIIQVAHNYEEQGMHPIIIKSSIDTKANTKISSRTGLEREVDYLLKPTDKIINNIDVVGVDCIIVDEAQFLTKDQVTELFIITKLMEKPVICYGLRTDYKAELFPGSKRLLALADELEEIKTICTCGKAARFNARYNLKTGDYIKDGEQVQIDDGTVGYKPMCGKCYIENVGLETENEITYAHYNKILTRGKAKMCK